jgi:hypothetical protein
LIAFEKFKEVNELSENCEQSVQLQQINYELNHINLQ